MAVYAEFRQDWATAVAHYRESYGAIIAVQVGCRPGLAWRGLAWGSGPFGPVGRVW